MARKPSAAAAAVQALAGVELPGRLARLLVCRQCGEALWGRRRFWSCPGATAS